MRKWVIALLLIIVLLIVSIYLLIPAKLDVMGINGIKANQQGILRTLMNDNKWRTWWPGETPDTIQGFSVGKRALHFHDQTYRVNNNTLTGFEIGIQDNATSINSVLTIIPIYVDSSQAEWRCQFSAGLNPIKRLQNYLTAKKIRRDFSLVLSAMQSFMENRKNIYDMPVNEAKVTDTFLISINTYFPHYPSTREIYDLFERLETYANQVGAQKTNSPMLHIEKSDSNNYKTIVAVPINKIIPNKGDYTFKRMVPGNIIVAEITGGDSTIKKGFIQLGNFLQDYHKASVALQFESLVTDRLKEQDTSKWKTRLYYPVY